MRIRNFTSSDSDKIRIPKYFHELFGKETTKGELAIVLFSCLILSTLLLFHGYAEFTELQLWKKLVLILLTLDITGGVVANVTTATNGFYQSSKKMRVIFLAIHVQPLLLGWLLGDVPLGLSVWGLTLLGASIIRNLRPNGIQRSAGMAMSLIGACFLLVNAEAFSLLSALLALYCGKLIFSFAVDHDMFSTSSK